jgi:cyclophilin family peptidyl-prolyl cis-trans isomerase
VIAFTKAPPICISTKDTYEATFYTDLGSFVVTMDPKKSLAAVNNFVFLARYHFFDGIIFHRVIPGFVVQGGDPTGTGSGGPGYSWTGNVPPKGCTAKGDCYQTGSIAMANSSGPSTNGSQFFLVLPGGAATLNQEPNYTNFGQVTSGLPIVEKLGSYGSPSGTPKAALYMIKVTITQIPG